MSKKTEGEIQKTISKLLQGAISNNWKLHSDSHKWLVERGSQTFKPIQKELLKGDWAKIKNPIELRIFGTLFQVLYEIDEIKSKNFAEKILSGKCDRIIVSQIKGILSFKKQDFLDFKFDQIEVFYSQDLNHPQFARKKVTRLLKKVPKDYLWGLERIYVVPPGRCGDDAIGSYDIFFGRICLEWRNWFGPLNPLTILTANLVTGGTLYHEIGHHVLGHSGGFRDEEKEKAADLFATRFNIIGAPIWGISIKTFYFFRNLFLPKKAPLKDVLKFWELGNIKKFEGIKKKEILKFENQKGIKFPREFTKFLQKTGGFQNKQICPNGFHFREFNKFEVFDFRGIEDENLKGSKFIFFCEHLPGERRFYLNVFPKSKNFGCIFRDGGKSKSGFIRVSKNFSFFLRFYLKDHPIFFA